MADRGGRTGGGSPRRRDGESDAAAWRPRSTVRMERTEQLLGVGVAVLYGLIAVLFLAVHPAHGHPAVRSAGPIATLVVAGLLVASLALRHRIVSGVLAIFGSFTTQTANVAHSVVYLRKVGFFLGIVYALYLTLQQSHAQRINRYGRLDDERRDKGLD